MLKPPFGSAPKHPGQYVLYMTKGERQEVHIFAAPYSARKFIEAVLEEDNYLVEGTFLRSESGIRIRCDLMEEVINHKYSKEEVEWELPHPHDKYARGFRHGPLPPRVVTEGLMEKRSRKSKSERRAPRSDDMLSISDIADKVGISPREARVILRKSKVPKPACGWAWNPEDAQVVEELLRKA